MPNRVKFLRASVSGTFVSAKDTRTSRGEVVIVKHGAKLEPRTVQIRGNATSVNLYTSYVKGKTVKSPNTSAKIDSGTGRKEG